MTIEEELPGIGPVWSETQLLKLLRERLEIVNRPTQNPSAHVAFLTHVRTGSGFDQQEIDAIVVDLWQSSHHRITGYEVKCSRGDWLREIHPDIAKSARARALVDSWVILAAPGVVKGDELPAGWGLMEPTKKADRLRTIVSPASTLDPLELPSLSSGPPVARGFVVAMLRAAGATPGWNRRRGLEKVWGADLTDS